jgi:hypothetical protein
MGERQPMGAQAGSATLESLEAVARGLPIAAVAPIHVAPTEVSKIALEDGNLGDPELF